MHALLPPSTNYTKVHATNGELISAILRLESDVYVSGMHFVAASADGSMYSEVF